MFFHGIFLPWLRRIGRWCFWPAVAVVAWGELTPHPPHLADEIFGWDKAEHFTAYFGLALLATLAWGLKRSLIWIYLSIVLLGGALEILQFYTGRDSDWHDELANCLGAAAGMGLAALYLAIPRHLVGGPPRD
jgi:VanZ family protein